VRDSLAFQFAPADLINLPLSVNKVLFDFFLWWQTTVGLGQSPVFEGCGGSNRTAIKYAFSGKPD
jgi:hypothetical protein